MVQGFMTKAGNTQTDGFGIRANKERSPETKLNSLISGGTGTRAATAMGTSTMTKTSSSPKRLF